MVTSSKHVASIFAVSILFQCSWAKPQYFSSPLHQINEKYDMKEDDTIDSRVQTNPYYHNYPGDDFLSDGWFAMNAFPTQENPNTFSSAEFSDSLIPPVYAENKFNPAISEVENQPINSQNDFDQFQRGRSDIEPEEEEEFLGYFYPKPKIPFDLPNFNPLSAASDVNTSTSKDTSITTTTTNAGESTEKTTTNITSQSSTDTSDKV